MKHPDSLSELWLEETDKKTASEHFQKPHHFHLQVLRQMLARCTTSKVKIIPIRCKPSDTYTAPSLVKAFAASSLKQIYY